MDTLSTKIDPAAELLENVSGPFQSARAMPCSVYTSEEFMQKELNQIFARNWFCAGRSDWLGQPGDYFAFDLAGQPIMVVRDGEGILRAHANVCRHRMSTLLEGCGNTRTIVCPYHGWTYNLDGRLRGAPAMTRNPAFDRKSNCLQSVRIEEWLGWILVTLNEDVPPASEALADIEEMIRDFDMPGYKQAFFEEFNWKTNWKVLADNFMESYHLPVCHAATIGARSKVDDVECPEGHERFNYHTIQKEEDFTLSVAHPDNTSLQGERRYMTYLIVIYPSMLVTLTPGYFWYLSLHPEEPGKVRIYFGGGMAKEFADKPESKEYFNDLRELLDVVNKEDRGCTERVYKGLSSRFGVPGHLSHLERPNFEFAKFISKSIPA